MFGTVSFSSGFIEYVYVEEAKIGINSTALKEKVAPNALM